MSSVLCVIENLSKLNSSIYAIDSSTLVDCKILSSDIVEVSNWAQLYKSQYSIKTPRIQKIFQINHDFRKCVGVYYYFTKSGISSPSRASGLVVSGRDWGASALFDPVLSGRIAIYSYYHGATCSYTVQASHPICEFPSIYEKLFCQINVSQSRVLELIYDSSPPRLLNIFLNGKIICDVPCAAYPISFASSLSQIYYYISRARSVRQLFWESARVWNLSDNSALAPIDFVNILPLAILMPSYIWTYPSSG